MAKQRSGMPAAVVEAKKWYPTEQICEHKSLLDRQIYKYPVGAWEGQEEQSDQDGGALAIVCRAEDFRPAYIPRVNGSVSYDMNETLCHPCPPNTFFTSHSNW